MDIKECSGKFANGYKTDVFNKLEIHFISITEIHLHFYERDTFASPSSLHKFSPEYYKVVKKMKGTYPYKIR